eukprot:Rmarinus@m.12465
MRTQLRIPLTSQDFETKQSKPLSPFSQRNPLCLASHSQKKNRSDPGSCEGDGGGKGITPGEHNMFEESANELQLEGSGPAENERLAPSPFLTTAHDLTGGAVRPAKAVPPVSTCEVGMQVSPVVWANGSAVKGEDEDLWECRRQMVSMRDHVSHVSAATQRVKDAYRTTLDRQRTALLAEQHRILSAFEEELSHNRLRHSGARARFEEMLYQIEFESEKALALKDTLRTCERLRVEVQEKQEKLSKRLNGLVEETETLEAQRDDLSAKYDDYTDPVKLQMISDMEQELLDTSFNSHKQLQERSCMDELTDAADAFYKAYVSPEGVTPEVARLLVRSMANAIPYALNSRLLGDFGVGVDSKIRNVGESVVKKHQDDLLAALDFHEEENSGSDAGPTRAPTERSDRSECGDLGEPSWRSNRSEGMREKRRLQRKATPEMRRNLSGESSTRLGTPKTKMSLLRAARLVKHRSLGSARSSPTPSLRGGGKPGIAQVIDIHRAQTRQRRQQAAAQRRGKRRKKRLKKMVRSLAERFVQGDIEGDVDLDGIRESLKESDPAIEVAKKLSVVKQKLMQLKRFHQRSEEIDQAIMIDLACPGCFELMRSPHTLIPCGHTLCYTCIQSNSQAEIERRIAHSTQLIREAEATGIERLVQKAKRTMPTQWDKGCSYCKECISGAIVNFNRSRRECGYVRTQSSRVTMVPETSEVASLANDMLSHDVEDDELDHEPRVAHARHLLQEAMMPRTVVPNKLLQSIVRTLLEKQKKQVDARAKLDICFWAYEEEMRKRKEEQLAMAAL